MPPARPHNDRFHYTRDDSLDRGEPRPSTSDGRGLNRSINEPREHTPEEKAQQMIREAETSKARIFGAPGNDHDNLIGGGEGPNLQHVPSAMVDESYIVVSGHLDETMINRIGRGEYVDFSRLLPRDRVYQEEDNRMEMCLKNGKAFWVPVHQGQNINGFSRWEQAFRVFANIYCKVNPGRAAEIIEYNHVIHMISSTYVWENVYAYDREFRLHMARNPNRSWGMILQQAWAMRLRDRISNQQYNHFSAGGNDGRGRTNEPCRRFNRGKCNFGTGCQYEHKCSYCFKFGHAAVNCRKALADRGGEGDKGGNHPDRKPGPSNNNNRPGGSGGAQIIAQPTSAK